MLSPTLMALLIPLLTKRPPARALADAKRKPSLALPAARLIRACQTSAKILPSLLTKLRSRSVCANTTCPFSSKMSPVASAKSFKEVMTLPVASVSFPEASTDAEITQLRMPGMYTSPSSGMPSMKSLKLRAPARMRELLNLSLIPESQDISAPKSRSLTPRFKRFALMPRRLS